MGSVVRIFTTEGITCLTTPEKLEYTAACSGDTMQNKVKIVDI